ncbi:hypothetical protein H1230_30065 [Paenibacillus sp. 19GGS1-52]|uniref:hypothetical protein n=1 Tax=Paenibacillus sp. 19GGS1-52 TaxID=2758563 RepID=UPI001EFB8D4C|nr:hypothetical protein [Paenibacillus sp. 19GGS1-52]ULO07134.1 hypothetical protein H1230_30065 [Paenibacillus sp. 19GGS1-52]
MWIKVCGAILFGLILTVLIMDFLVVDSVYDSNGRAIEHAIDAGIIRSGIVTDAQQGLVQLEQNTLRAATREAFIQSLHLSSALENPIMKDSSFELKLTYDSSDVPWIDVVFRTHVSFAIPGVTYPVTIHRNIPYESIYK